MPEIDLILTDGFSPLVLALTVEAMQAANRESAQQIWRWTLLSPGGGVRLGAAGVSALTEPLPLSGKEGGADIVLLLSEPEPGTAEEANLKGWLKAGSRRGAIVGCVEPGAGGFATLDLMLSLIERFQGPEPAATVARAMGCRRSGASGPANGFDGIPLDPVVANSIDLMLGTLSQPFPISEIARRARVPQWTLARRFEQSLGESPSACYRRLRLDEARRLARNSAFRISRVAELTGFASAESLNRAYRLRFGCPPMVDRAVARGMRGEKRR